MLGEGQKLYGQELGGGTILVRGESPPKWSPAQPIRKPILHQIWEPISLVYLSPCFRLINFPGNSWRQQYPKTAVSSKAWYLWELRSMFPARKSLHSYQNELWNSNQASCITLWTQRNSLGMQFQYGGRLLTWGMDVGLFLRELSSTNWSTADCSQKNKLWWRGSRWLMPADFFLGKPNKASIENTNFPSPWCVVYTIIIMQYNITDINHPYLRAGWTHIPQIEPFTQVAHVTNIVLQKSTVSYHTWWK